MELVDNMYTVMMQIGTHLPKIERLGLAPRPGCFLNLLMIHHMGYRRLKTIDFGACGYYESDGTLCSSRKMCG